MKETVLAVLKDNLFSYVSGEELSSRLNVSRTAIWKHIGALREDGYEIESAPRLGYRLLAVPDLLLPSEIHAGLETNILGKKVIHQHEVESTNRVLRELADKGEPEGTVVLAEQQTAGRGRLGRSWSSPQGGVWLSVLLRPSLPPFKVQLVTLLAAVAAVEATETVVGITPGIKWPNDLLVDGKKLAGILTEVSAEMERVNYLILGIGINVNIPAGNFTGELTETATSLQAATGSSTDRVAWVKTFLTKLEREYIRAQKQGFSDVLERWRRYSVTIGYAVDVNLGNHTVSGTAVDIDEQGALLVKTDTAVETFLAGDVSLKPDKDQ
ncbi:MAG: biotin--[acetyl-CoA-carboxylase] ligase [Bacillota bacterium]|nr:biotin--[acetyl-CoA-carboxylase] ligase [Bacillota bacterium]MDW7683095.1 biotin--[acetyl-CoA-carboxylase] ligase [Bacillota bacterium]